MAVNSQVAYGVDRGHAGHQNDPLLVPPLTRLWGRSLPTPGTNPILSYPVIVDGRVFVTSLQYDVASVVYGLDLRTGRTLWGPIAIGGSGHWSNATYEAGRLFAVNNMGGAYALDPATGAVLWHTEIGSDVSSAPVAAAGHVYLVSTGGLWALRQTDGKILWLRKWLDSAVSASPAVDQDGVYVTLTCHE